MSGMERRVQYHTLVWNWGIVSTQQWLNWVKTVRQSGRGGRQRVVSVAGRNRFKTCLKSQTVTPALYVACGLHSKFKSKTIYRLSILTVQRRRPCGISWRFFLLEGLLAVTSPVKPQHGVNTFPQKISKGKNNLCLKMFFKVTWYLALICEFRWFE